MTIVCDWERGKRTAFIGNSVYTVSRMRPRLSQASRAVSRMRPGLYHVSWAVSRMRPGPHHVSWAVSRVPGCTTHALRAVLRMPQAVSRVPGCTVPWPHRVLVTRGQARSPHLTKSLGEPCGRVQGTEGCAPLPINKCGNWKGRSSPSTFRAFRRDASQTLVRGGLGPLSVP